MQRMNPTDGHNLPYWWSTALGVNEMVTPTLKAYADEVFPFWRRPS